SLLRLGAALRRRVWQLCQYAPAAVRVNIDTTVSTVYGEIEGARKGHNPKHRGKKGLRPVLCFVAETREYLCGTQRRGEPMNGAGIGTAPMNTTSVGISRKAGSSPVGLWPCVSARSSGGIGS